MATYTTNIGLEKPESNDNVDVHVLNENYDLIDDEFATKKVVGSKIDTDIPANTNTCRIDIPNSCCFFAIFSLPALNRTWCGIVYCGAGGVVEVEQMNGGNGLTLTPGTNKLTFSFAYTSDTKFSCVYIPFRGSAAPSFH